MFAYRISKRKHCFICRGSVQSSGSVASVLDVDAGHRADVHALQLGQGLDLDLLGGPAALSPKEHGQLCILLYVAWLQVGAARPGGIGAPGSISVAGHRESQVYSRLTSSLCM